MNLAKNLECAARNFPEHTAVLEDGRETSYRELNLQANRVASAVTKLGCRPGEPVGICLPNGLEWMAAYFGVLKAGCVAVPLFAGLNKNEFRSILNDFKPGLLFLSPERALDIQDGNHPEFIKKIISPNGDLTFSELLDQGRDEFQAVPRNRQDLAALLYTGGTTGVPKGVMLSHENILTSAHNVARQERSTERDRVLCFLPLNHVFGQVHVMHSTVLTAGSLDFLPGFDLDRVLTAFEHSGITKFYAVPTIYVRLLGLDNLKQRLGSVRYCFSAAASMARELVLEWKKATGLDIHEAYGMTESAAMVSYNHYYRHKVGSVGTAVGTVEIAIFDQAGRQLPQGREGEICIQGPNIMKGYWNRTLETENAFWGPWFRSGDVGYLDEEGYLFIVDRIKDLIITGGENVYPREVEELLFQLPEVEECSVVGLPDREYGERVTAVIKTRAGVALDSDAIRFFLKEHLSPFKVPKSFIPMDELPKSSTGKILKREIKRKLVEEDER